MPDFPTDSVPSQSRHSEVERSDEITLLVEILQSRADGVIDMRAGTADEDLLYALEEALPKLQKLKEDLDA